MDAWIEPRAEPRPSQSAQPHRFSFVCRREETSDHHDQLLSFMVFFGVCVCVCVCVSVDCSRHHYADLQEYTPSDHTAGADLAVDPQPLRCSPLFTTCVRSKLNFTRLFIPCFFNSLHLSKSRTGRRLSSSSSSSSSRGLPSDVHLRSLRLELGCFPLHRCLPDPLRSRE